MKVLIIKKSSLGDLIHTFPALTDAQNAIPDITFDWVVEEAFAAVPKWHLHVNRVIPIAWRRWRKNFLGVFFGKEFRNFLRTLRAEKYDAVIDAQGLIKSGLVAFLSRGARMGFNKRSLTEPLARFVYQKMADVDLTQHAVFRMRSLFAQLLNYSLPESFPDFGITKTQFKNPFNHQNYILFVHGTTWKTKHWPDEYWLKLIDLIEKMNYKILVPWFNEEEKMRAELFQKRSEIVTVLPKLSLDEMAGVIANAAGVVTVDTGLGHIAAALDVPTVSLYGPTDVKRTGTVGRKQQALVANFECAPCDKKQCIYQGLAKVMPACFSTISPEKVWETLQMIIKD